MALEFNPNSHLTEVDLVILAHRDATARGKTASIHIGAVCTVEIFDLRAWPSEIDHRMRPRDARRRPTKRPQIYIGHVPRITAASDYEFEPWGQRDGLPGGRKHKARCATDDMLSAVTAFEGRGNTLGDAHDQRRTTTVAEDCAVQRA